MKVEFDDEKVSMTFTTPAGNTIKVDEDEGKILIEDQNSNKIEMSGDGIKMESPADISIKATGDVKIEGVNVEISASASMKASGSAGAELSSSGSTKVQGSMVQIN